MTYDPHSGWPYAPQPTPPSNKVGKIIGIGCAGVLALVLFGGCMAAITSDSADGEKTSSSDSARPSATISDTATAGLDSGTVTELSIGIAWEQYSESDKDLMCSGIDAFGTDWAAREMRKGGSTDSGIDWDYAAQLVEEKCTARDS
jgi:hypothetical protein